MAVAHRSSSGGPDLNTALPTGNAQDDVLTAEVTTEVNGTTPTAATGWTLIDGYTTCNEAGRPLSAHWYWIARGASPPATNWSTGGASASQVGYMCYSGVDTTSPIAGYAKNTTGGAGDTSIECLSFTNSTADSMEIGMAAVNDWLSSSSTDFANERIDGATTHSQHFYDNGTQASGTIAQRVITGSAGWHSIHLALKPAAGGPTAPAAPTAVAGTILNGGVALTWTNGSDGGSSITSTDVDWATAAAPTTWLGPTNISPASAYDKMGLTNGTAYVFRVRNNNAIGNGTWSSSSASVTPTSDLVVIESQNAAVADRSPSLTFTIQPRANDIVLMFPSSTTTATITLPGSWENPLGTTTDVESDSHQICCVGYRVTATDQNSAVKTYTATNLYDAAETGNVVGCLIRNADTTSMFAGVNSTFSSSNTVTPHVLAGVTPSASNGQAFSAVAKDGTGTYTTPGGWTQLTTSNTNQGKWLGIYNTLTTSGTPISATNITPSAGDEYASITVVIPKKLGINVAIGQAIETETAQAITKFKVKAIGQASETDAAQTITRVTAIFGSVGQASETETAQAITKFKVKAIGQASETDSAQTIVVPAAVLCPVSVSGRKILDQNGDPYLLPTMSSWGMATQLSNTDITTALEDVAGLGFKGVTVWIGGGYEVGTAPTGWNRYTNQGGQSYWTGTPWASSLGAAWGTVDHIVSECGRLGLVLSASFCGGFGTTGAGPDWEGVTNTNMYDAGVAIATRYVSATNIVWHIMLDDTTTQASTRGTRILNLFDGINDTEGTTTRAVRWLECANGNSTNDQGWYATGFFNATINCMYNYTVTNGDSVAAFETVWGQTSGPTGDCEPAYVGAPHYPGNEGQQLRERNYSVFIEGGCLINFGHEDWWRYGADGFYSAGLTWDQVMASTPLVQAGYAWSLINTYMKHASWAPTSSFVTTGEGTSGSKAAQGTRGDVAIAYFPDSRTIAVDTTILTGTGNVRLRWYDPTAGTFSTIAANEAQQTGRSITYPSAHGDSTNDWVLVVDLVPGTYAVGQTTETDTAQTIAKSKLKAIGQTTQTDAAQAIGRIKTKILGQAIETEVSQSLTRFKVKAFGQTTEVDESLTVARFKVKAVGQSVEIDTAQPIQTSVPSGIGQTTETDIAQSITAIKSKVIGQASETDTTQVLVRVKTKVIGQTTESDITFILVRNKSIVLVQTTEADTSQALTVFKAKAIGQVTETDVAQIIQPSVPSGLGQSVETDVAQPITSRKVKAIGLATETDVAQPIQHSVPQGVGQASESDAAQPINKAKVKAFGQIGETDAAQSIATAKTKATGQSTETNAAQPLNRIKTKILGLAVETDATQTLTKFKVKTFGSTIETDVAQPIQSSVPFGVGQTLESDVAQPFGSRKVKAFGQVTETESVEPIARFKSRILGQVDETDSVTAVIKSKTKTTSQAVETETAFAITARKTKTIGQVVETDTARALVLVRTHPIGVATETDATFAVTHIKVKAFGMAAQTEIATAFLHGNAYGLDQAIETDTALAVSHRKTQTFAPSVESEVAMSISPKRTYTLGLAAETETSISIVRVKTRPIGQATTTDNSFTLTWNKVHALGMAMEVDVALQTLMLGLTVLGTCRLALNSAGCSLAVNSATVTLTVSED